MVLDENAGRLRCRNPSSVPSVEIDVRQFNLLLVDRSGINRENRGSER